MVQKRFPGLVRLNHGHPEAEGGGEGEKKRKRTRKEREQMEAQRAASDDDGGGGGERTGGDIQEAEESGDRALNHTDSSEDEEAGRETRRMTRCQDESPSSRGEHGGGFEDEGEQGDP